MNGARLILTSRYLKSGTAKNASKRRNYTKYIATRETVEIRDQNSFHDANAPATAKQKNLIKELLTDFPESKNYLEYADYTAYPTVANASELISTVVEQNVDIIGNKKNFVGYMAMRPGAEKRGTHGLFNSSDKPIILNQAANEIANHQGNVWSHVISLRRSDAVRLGYDNSDRWRELIKRHIMEIADAHKIPLCNLKWYAAFHNTTHHPHIHLLVYSTDPKQGYLTKKGIEKMRSMLANDIFHDELQSIYQEQTVSRDDLKKLSETEFDEILKQIQDSEFHHPRLEQLVKKLYSQLRKTKGKKIYGYLPKEVKQTVNKIFLELAKDDKINQLYEKWCQLEKLKYKSYTITEPELPSLTENKTFHSVRNMIIRNVLKMDSLIMLGQPDSLDIEKELTDDIYYQLDWSEDYRKAHELLKKLNASEQEKQKSLGLLINEAKNGNIFALLDLGKICGGNFLGEPDAEKSYQCYAKALNEMIKLEPKVKKTKAGLQYQIGRMFCYGICTEKNPEKAVEYLTLSEQAGNLYAKRLLGRELLSGKNIPKNIEEGIRMLSECAESDDLSSAYLLAKFLLQDTAYKNPVKVMELLKKSAEQNAGASFLLGKLYLFGTDKTEPDRESAVLWLTKSAEGGNIYAQKLLDNMQEYQNQVFADISFRLFIGLSKIIEEDYHQEQKQLSSHVESKLKNMMERKKKELGIRTEQSQNY